MPWEESEEYVRSGHQSTDKFDKDSMRTKTLDAAEGMKAVVGCPKGNYKGGRCQVGLEVVSYLFAKEKGWTLPKAKEWYAKHEEETKRSKERTKEKKKA